MNIIWILLWGLLSLFVVGAFMWSTRILTVQKRAWGAFASKYRLSYEKNGFFSSPSVHGKFQGFTLNVYSEEQPSPDARGVRFRSVIELMGKSFLPLSGAVASGDLVALIANLELPSEYVPASDLWHGTYLAKTDDRDAMARFLKEENLETLSRLMKKERTSFLVIFDSEDLLLRFETGDPLHDPRRLDRYVKMMADMYRTLEKDTGHITASAKKEDAADGTESENRTESGGGEENLKKDPEEESGEGKAEADKEEQPSGKRPPAKAGKPEGK